MDNINDLKKKLEECNYYLPDDFNKYQNNLIYGTSFSIKDFLNFLGTYFKIQYDLSDINKEINKFLPDYQTKEISNKEAILKTKVLLQSLKSIMEQEVYKIIEKEEKNKEKHNIFKFKEEYNLNNKEFIAFLYVFILEAKIEIDEMLQKAIENYNAFISNLAFVSSMNYEEIHNFANSKREYIKDQIILLDLSLNEKITLDTEVEIPSDVIKVFLGYPLYDEEIIKYSGTKFYNLILNKSENIIEKKEETENNDVVEDFFKDFDEKEENVEELLEEKDISSYEKITIKPYKSDLDYLNEYFKYITLLLKYAIHFKLEKKYFKEGISERELKTRIEYQEKICEERLRQTLKKTNMVPRLEKLVNKYKLDKKEKIIILILAALLINAEFKSAFKDVSYSSDIQVQDILLLISNDFEEAIKYRKYFYKNSPLFKYSLVLADRRRFESEISKLELQLDSRILDYITGLEIEEGEIVEGSAIYTPNVDLKNVILPEEQKNLIIKTIANYQKYKKAIKKFKIHEVTSSGTGIVVLFYGPSGTGKTFMANAIAKKLNKKIFLINFPKLWDLGNGEIFKTLFREAKINNAIIFFDECEQIFKSYEATRERPSEFLTEIEKHDGIIIMATNKPAYMDEAMHRRITLSVEFKVPDVILREKIWKIHLPKEKMYLSKDVNLKELAKRFELTGGLIKNAVLIAISLAVSRNSEKPIITMSDLEKGAKLQLVSRLKMLDLEKQKVPEKGIDSLILYEDCYEKIKSIIDYEKAKKILFSQWGFDEHSAYEQGTSALFFGPPGTGKTLATEVIAYELGMTLKTVHSATLISKWVGETSKNIENVFKDAMGSEALLVFDDAESIFGERTAIGDSTDRYANIDVSNLLFQMENFPGIVILTTNKPDIIDKAFLRRIRFIVEFKNPDFNLRKKLWKFLLPSKLPLKDEINFDLLAKRFEFTGGHIKNAIFRAAAKVALKDENSRYLTTEDLIKASEEEVVEFGKKTLGFI